jgi:ATP synthase protein I
VAVYQGKRVPSPFDGPRSGPIYSPRSMAPSPRPGAPPDDSWSGMSTGWQVTAYLLGGILSWGGIGYLVDRLAGTGRLFLPIGMVLGAVGAIYLVYLRFGRGDAGRR